MDGILDPDGLKMNPLTGGPYSDKYRELAKKWSALPAYEMRDSLIKSIRENQVLLVESSTGSGKTVLIPKFALHTLDYKGRVVVTLPKQMIAKSSAEFAAATLDVEVGKQIGYQYRGSPKSAKSGENKILYSTDGTIVQQLLRDPKLEGIDIVIIDEAHERKIQIDFLLYLLKEALKIRPTFKIIIMSATINKAIFESYFNQFRFKSVSVGGKRLFPIESIFLNRSLQYDKILEKGFEILLDLLLNEPDGDILFFVTSVNEAYGICKKLNSQHQKSGGTFCVELYSGVNERQQLLAQDKILYKEQGEYGRKVVISTNVAESSLTVDGIKFVIETGHELLSSYDPNKRARQLDRKLITRSQAMQRMGRSGRTEPGVCYHLYTEKDFNEKMESYPKPDIRTSDISEECLSLLRLHRNLPNLLDVLTKFLEPPLEEYIVDAFNRLIELELVQNNTITELGETVSSISNDLHAGIALIYAKNLNCSHEMSKIFALLEACKGNIGDIFNSPTKIEDKELYKKAVERFNKVKKKFTHRSGDHLSLLKIFEEYEKQKDKKPDEWCRNNLIKFKTMQKAGRYRRQIRDRLRDLNFKIDGVDDIRQKNLDDRVLHCLRVAYNDNLGFKEGNRYRTSTMTVEVDRDSFMTKLPKKVFYNEIFINMGMPKLKIVSMA